MTFTIKIDTDNAAFSPDPAPELARILRSIAYRLTTSSAPYDTFQPIFDVNGNSVGRFALKELDPLF